MKALLTAFAFTLALAGPAQAASPIVVELFTSQGCSSCPPANDNFRSLADRPDILALSFSVTYWDSLGWKDTFGRPEYTQRQYSYSRGLGYRNPFTPEMVFNGRAYVVGNNSGEIEDTLARVARAEGPVLSLSNGTLAIAAREKPKDPAIVWLVRYDPRTVNVPVGRGENAGVTLPHRNVVHALVKLGTWNGEAASFPVPAAADGMSTAILVQEPGGVILSALKA